MEKNSDIFRHDLLKIKDELQSLKEKIQTNVNKEDIYLFKIEDYCNSIRNAIIDCTLNLPDISSFEFYLSKLKEQANIEYILSLLHHCWLLVNPDRMFNAPHKDEDPEKILEKSLSKYTGDHLSKYDESYDMVSKELDASVKITIASFYYRKVKENEMLHFFREYIDELHKKIKNIYEHWGLTIRNDFIPIRCLQVELSRNQLQALFKAVALKEYMTNDKVTENTFLSLFSNTLHTTDKKIIWRDINTKNNRPSIASLYVMFAAMGIDMNLQNKTIICKFFNDAKNEPILPDELKPRKESDPLRKLRSIVEDICKN